MVRPTINSKKHIVQTSITSATPGAVTKLVLIDAQQGASPSVPTSVEVGSIVKAVYIDLWFIGSSSQPTTMTCTLEKTVAENPDMTFVQSQQLYTYPNKKNIFYSTQGFVGDANSNPTPFLRTWYKIPKGKQRFGVGDGLRLNITGITETTEFCGLCIYKEYN